MGVLVQPNGRSGLFHYIVCANIASLLELYQWRLRKKLLAEFRLSHADIVLQCPGSEQVGCRIAIIAKTNANITTTAEKRAIPGLVSIK